MQHRSRRFWVYAAGLCHDITSSLSGNVLHARGDEELRGKDFAFIRDRKGARVPAKVVLPPEQPWKWLTKSVVGDIGPMEYFYDSRTNARLLWKPTDTTREQQICVQRLLTLPPLYRVLYGSPKLPVRTTPVHHFVCGWYTCSSHSRAVSAVLGVVHRCSTPRCNPID